MRVWTCEKSKNGVAVWRADDGAYCVTGVDWDRDQVTSLRPSDCPTDGGQWCGRITDAGIRYVSSPCARATAYRYLRAAAREARLYA